MRARLRRSADYQECVGRDVGGGVAADPAGGVSGRRACAGDDVALVKVEGVLANPNPRVAVGTILAGLTALGCVEGTGRWALELAYTVTLVKDATAAFSFEHLHAAVELNAPIYAEQVLTTADLIAALKS